MGVSLEKMIRIIEHQKHELVPIHVVDWLKLLNGPTAIKVRGSNNQGARLVVTLLHGNEPSGILALHHLLKNNWQPIYNMTFVVASVDVALAGNRFQHRHLPQEQDLNRVFSIEEPETKIEFRAAEILDFIKSQKWECIVDLHNTSGKGPAFGVTTHNTPEHIALSSLFCHRVIKTEMQVGSLMEQNLGAPVVTIECGGANQESSHINAVEGIKNLGDILQPLNVSHKVVVMNHPKRLEIDDTLRIGFASEENPMWDVTFINTLEDLNLGRNGTNTFIGWAKDSSLKGLRLRHADDTYSPQDIFKLTNGELYLNRKLDIFMATTNADIAKEDCLLYVVG